MQVVIFFNNFFHENQFDDLSTVSKPEDVSVHKEIVSFNYIIMDVIWKNYEIQVFFFETCWTRIIKGIVQVIGKCSVFERDEFVSVVKLQRLGESVLQKLYNSAWSKCGSVGTYYSGLRCWNVSIANCHAIIAGPLCLVELCTQLYIRVLPIGWMVRMIVLYSSFILQTLLYRTTRPVTVVAFWKFYCRFFFFLVPERGFVCLFVCFCFLVPERGCFLWGRHMCIKLHNFIENQYFLKSITLKALPITAYNSTCISTLPYQACPIGTRILPQPKFGP